MIKEFGIVFSGQARQLHKGHEDFIKLVEGLDYDVFGHIWECGSLLSAWGNGMGWENKQTKIHTPQEFIDLYKPVRCESEDYTKTEFHRYTSSNNGYLNPVNKFYSSCSQFYSLKQGFIVKENFEKEKGDTYKYGVRYRTDLEVDFKESKIDWDSFKERIDKNPNLILVNPGWDWPNGNGCANHFAIGTSDAMKKYSLIFDNYSVIVRNNIYGNYDESNLKMHLEKFCGLTVEHCSIHHGVYR